MVYIPTRQTLIGENYCAAGVTNDAASRQACRHIAVCPCCHNQLHSDPPLDLAVYLYMRGGESERGRERGGKRERERERERHLPMS